MKPIQSCLNATFALLALLLFGLCPATAEITELRVGSDGSYALSNAMMYLEDAGGRLSFDDIKGAEAQQRFAPLARGGAGINFGLTRSAFWLRATLRRPANAPSRWLLEIAYPTLDRVELYVSSGAGFERQLSGDLLPFTARPFPHRNLVFPIELPPDVASTIYLRVESQGTVSVPARLWQPEALWQHDHQVYSVFSLYFGMVMALALFNLLLYFLLRDRLYLIYVAFAASMAVGLSAMHGFGGQFLWPHWAWWTNVSLPAGMGVTGFFATMFARDFLSTAVKLPRLDRGLVALAALFALTTAAALLLPYWISGWMVNIVGVTFSLYVVAVGAYSLRQGHPGARYFLLAWTMLLVGAGAISLHNLGKLPSNLFTTNSLLIGSALEMLLLSFALAERINITRREKALAQADAIAARESMVDSLRASEHLLELRVAQRTGELLQANARLKEHESLLKQQAHHDALTGLPNRKLLNDRLALAIERAKRSSEGFALLMIDLDGFKVINDTYGHAAGDTVLIEVARRMTAALRASDTVARFGGDEFVVILETGEDASDASVVVKKLAQTASEPIALDGGRLASIGISVGVALYPHDATGPDQLLMLADHAMYRAKAAHHTDRTQASDR